MLKRIYKRKNWILIFTAVCLIAFSVFFACLKRDKQEEGYRLIPEYRQTLKKVAFSLSVFDKSLKTHDKLLATLPKYSQICLLTPENIFESISEELESKPYAANTILIPYKTKDETWPKLSLYDKNENKFKFVTAPHLLLPQGTKWIRDSFKSLVNSKGESLLYSPIVNEGFYCTDENEIGNFVQDNIYLKQLSNFGMKVKYGSLFFEGGNIVVGEVGGERIAFVGNDTIKETGATKKYLPKIIVNRSALKPYLQDIFGVDDIVFVGFTNKLQPKKMFHLDQSMIFLDDGIVGVSRILGDNPESPKELEFINETKRFLLETRSLLISLGFDVYDINTTIRNVLDYEEYVNAIPYKNVETGQKELLMPVFRSNLTSYDKQIEDENIMLFESLGYHVIKVPVFSTALKGGIHCLVNVIS